MKVTQRILLECKADLSQPYLVAIIGALNMRETVGHFSTPTEVMKCLTLELGVEPSQAEKAIADLKANGRAFVTRVVQG
jgi:hypothetical protein